MKDRYWLSAWLDHNDFSSVEEAERSLASPTVVSELRQLASKAFRRTKSYVPDPAAPLKFSLLAGKGIDLSGQLSCRSEVCRKRQVDELFGRVWHYFDRIVVNDNLAMDISHHWEDPEWKVKDGLLSNIRVLLYLRAIGAEDLVEFRPKPPACTVHLQQHANEAGLTALTSNIESIVEIFLPNAHISFRTDNNGTQTFRLAHPLLEISQSGSLDEDEDSEIGGDTRRKAMTIVVRRLIAHLSSDIAASHRYNASLGTVLKTHELFLRQLRPTSVSDVIVNLRLPVLDGLQPWDLIEIRRDESDYFDRFRDALTKAVTERLKIQPNVNPTKLADELQADLIEPRLRDISSRLTAAQKLMTKKSGVGLVLGAISTTCGILSGLDPHIATMGGTGITLACTGTATSKYLDEARDVSMDDMYFLWKAAECAPH